MAKKHKHPEHANHERWLVSYADFITLLFATFTALYALGRSDADKAKAVAESMRYYFGAATNSMVPKAVLSYLGIPADRTQPPSARIAMVEPKEPTKGAGKGDLETAKNQIVNYLMTQKLLGKVRVELDKEGLHISLTEAGFFPSGQAELLPGSREALANIAAHLRSFTNPIRVEGYTDNVPIHSRSYPSNWELSSARAAYVVRVLAQDYGIWPARLSAVGYGEYHPAFSNATAAGRARNRRVDIVLLSGSGPAGQPGTDNSADATSPAASPPSPSPWSTDDSSDAPVGVP